LNMTTFEPTSLASSTSASISSSLKHSYLIIESLYGNRLY
jgi:hypothetical protein